MASNLIIKPAVGNIWPPVPFEVSVTFTNPHPIMLDRQDFSISFDIIYDNSNFVNITLPSSTTIVLGENTDFKITGVLKDPHISGKLLYRFCMGEDIHVTIVNMTLAFDEGRTRVNWLVDLMSDLVIPIDIPGGSGPDICNDEFSNLIL